MNDKYENMSVFEQIQAGLEDGIAHSKGILSLKSIDLPAPPPKTLPRAIAKMRNRLGMSQAVFAATLNVSTRTVQSWEQGTREPSDAALRFLQVIREQPSVVKMIFRTTKTGRRGSRTATTPGRTSRRRSA